MPLYYFHFISEGERCEDAEGLEFPDIEAAEQYCRVALGDLAADAIRRGSLDAQSAIELTNAHGACLATVKIRSTISIESRPV